MLSMKDPTFSTGLSQHSWPRVCRPMVSAQRARLHVVHSDACPTHLVCPRQDANISGSATLQLLIEARREARRTAYARAASPLAGPRYARIAGPSPQTARVGRARPAVEQPLRRVARRGHALVAGRGREEPVAGASASATLAIMPAWVAPSSRYGPAATLGCGELERDRAQNPARLVSVPTGTPPVSVEVELDGPKRVDLELDDALFLSFGTLASPI